jgi:hypothetical protein
MSCSGDGKKLSFGSLDVYYTEGVTVAEAEAVGDYLNGIGFGVGDEKEKIQISKNEDRYTCKFVMADGKVSLENIWKRYGKSISKNVLNGAPVDVDLCDENFNSLKFLIAE